MTVTVASFRANHPQEFGNQSSYPPQAIAYWLAVAQVLLGLGTGSSPTACSFTGATAAGVLTTSALTFGSLSLFPLILQGNTVPANGAILGQVTGPAGGAGTYQVNFNDVIGAEAMIALRGAIPFASANSFWGAPSSTADTPPTTVADFATEMWIAHQLVLEKQAVDAARNGGDPGTKIGIMSSKSVNGVSVGFDIGSVAGGSLQENAGYYNQTVYGMRFYRLMKLRGSGPIQIGVGTAPAFALFNSFGFLGSSNAWAGPYPGIEQGDTGF